MMDYKPFSEKDNHRIYLADQGIRLLALDNSLKTRPFYNSLSLNLLVCTHPPTVRGVAWATLWRGRTSTVSWASFSPPSSAYFSLEPDRATIIAALNCVYVFYESPGGLIEEPVVKVHHRTKFSWH